MLCLLPAGTLPSNLRYVTLGIWALQIYSEHIIALYMFSLSATAVRVASCSHFVVLLLGNRWLGEFETLFYILLYIVIGIFINTLLLSQVNSCILKEHSCNISTVVPHYHVYWPPPPPPQPMATHFIQPEMICINFFLITTTSHHWPPRVPNAASGQLFRLEININYPLPMAKLQSVYRVCLATNKQCLLNSMTNCL